MRCLNCYTDGLPLDTEICPNCNVHLPSLMREILPGRTQLRAGTYQIDYALGRGGFGVTYRGHHTLLEQLVAIKEYFPQTCAVRNPTTGGFTIPRNQEDTFERGKRRFLKEGKILARLRHPHVVGVTDLFEENDTAYLVMELVAGRSLRTELESQRGRKLSPERVREITGQLVEALAAVHQEGVFHLDVKPGNVLLTPEVKSVLVDFGSAKQAVGTIGGRSSIRTFTQEYAAPEVIGSGKVGVESDIFELGMMVYEMLMGELPPNALLRLTQIDWKPEGLASPWRELLTAALAYNKEDRPKDVGEWWGMVGGGKKSVAPPVNPSATSVSKSAANKSPSPTINPSVKSVTKSVANKSPSPTINPSVKSVTKSAANKSPSPAVNPSVKSVTKSAANKSSVPTSTVSFETVTVNAEGKIVKREPRQAEVFVEDLGPGVKLEMVSIPGGSFMMGSPENEKERNKNESPQHRVKVPPFFLGRYPVTQKQYEAVMGKNPSYSKGANRPVEYVSWNDATEFCRRLSQKTGKIYRLPSEAEWEYACRAGTTTPFYFGPTITTDLANCKGNKNYASAPKGVFRQQTTDVGSFPPNAFGLYDMHGNVWEWCQDVWHDNYNGASTDGSAWESGGNGRYRLLRGGSWGSNPRDCRCADRDRDIAEDWDNHWGFRLVLLAEGDSRGVEERSKTVAEGKKSVAPPVKPSVTSRKTGKMPVSAANYFETVTVNARGRVIKRESRQAEIFVENLGPGVKLEMVSIPGGSFLIGSPESEEKRSKYESPQHRVNVPPFFLGRYPVTQKQYKAVMGKNPSNFKGTNRPVEKVSWNDATEFCQKLSQKTGKIYRLPSEAEWEYACRAGTTTPFYFGPTITADLANYCGNETYGSASKGVFRKETTDVGRFSPNAFGLYDMHGNVWEWCQDVWHGNYNGAPTNGSAWESGWGLRRSLRGGSWFNNPWNCRSANRIGGDAAFGFNSEFGFRVVLMPGV